MAEREVSLRVDSVEPPTAVKSVVTPTESTSKSSDHRVHYPGENLKPSQITCGQGNNILHVAAKYRGSSDVKDILESHPLLANETNLKGDTPLHIAARMGKLDVVEILVDIIVKYEKKRLADAEAEYKKAQEQYMECMEKTNNKGNNTPDEAELVKRLVEAENKRLEEAKTKYKHAQDTYEENLRKVNNKGNTALHEAVMHGHCDIADLLINADPMLTSFDNKDGESPLFLAVDGGYEKAARQILNTFPKCSVSGRNGLAIMHPIVIREHPYQFVEEVMKILGPQVLEIADEFGWMPHHYAAKMGFSRILEIILRTTHSLAYIKDKEGMSALHIASKNGHTQVIITIIKECPDVCELLDNKGRTALHIAVEHKWPFALRALLKTTAFNDLLNEQDNEGNTALHLACIYGQGRNIIPLLFDRGTNKRIINKKGMTSFDYINRSSTLGAFDKHLIKSKWKIKDLCSLQALKDIKENATFLETDHQSNQEGVDASVVKENEKTNKVNESVENTADVKVLVATIIASITFAAAMNMPGSYDGSTGLANLREETSFRYFLVFDSLAFGCSSAVMLTHFAIRPHLKRRDEAYEFLIGLTTFLTFMSIAWTVLAFIMGTYSVLYQHKDVPNSKTGFGLPGNFAFTAFFLTLMYLFGPLVESSLFD